MNMEFSIDAYKILLEFALAASLEKKAVEICIDKLSIADIITPINS
jgi:hypothetical protein